MSSESSRKDARIRVVFGGRAAEGEALLMEAEGAFEPGRAVAYFHIPAGLHPADCACCAPRNPASSALTRLFLARARGEAPYFTQVRVSATPEGEEIVRACLLNDVLASARFLAVTLPESDSE